MADGRPAVKPSPSSSPASPTSAAAAAAAVVHGFLCQVEAIKPPPSPPARVSKLRRLHLPSLARARHRRIFRRVVGADAHLAPRRRGRAHAAVDGVTGLIGIGIGDRVFFFLLLVNEGPGPCIYELHSLVRVWCRSTCSIAGAMASSWRMLVVQGLASLAFLSGAAGEYVRPPPSPLVLVAHDKPASHPQQVHISVVGKNKMRISWVTDDRGAPSVVEYGTSPGSYTASATGDRTTYHYFFYKSGAMHHVTIGPLEPSTTYYYRCGRAGGELALRTPPAALPVEFVVVGDLGQTGWTASTLAHVAAADYDVLLLPGDLSYADAKQPLWDSFGRLVQPLASARPWMTTAGNHEIETLPVVEFVLPPFVAYNARWRMQHEESGGGGGGAASNLYYSFDAGGGAAHVVMLGSYTAFDEGSPQRAWLEKDLAAVDRRRTPWLVAVLHAPWYNTNEAHQGEGEPMREAMEKLLYHGRVDVVFSGHVHAYERFTRIYDNNADSRGPMYITVGDGGNREGLALNFMEDHKSASLSVFREASFGHGRLRIVNATSAVWRWHRNDDKQATVADEVWLESLAAPQPAARRHGADEL